MKKILFVVCQILFLNSWGQLAVHNGQSMQVHANANMGVKGDVSNSGTFNNNLGKVWLNGTARQTIEGNNLIQFNNISIKPKNLPSGAYTITLHSAEMKVLMSKEIHIEGQKREEKTLVQLQDLHLNSGVYYLRLSGKATNETIPIIKL